VRKFIPKVLIAWPAPLALGLPLHPNFICYFFIQMMQTNLAAGVSGGTRPLLIVRPTDLYVTLSEGEYVSTSAGGS
jgi:hypothetical protein